MQSASALSNQYGLCRFAGGRITVFLFHSNAVTAKTSNCVSHGHRLCCHGPPQGPRLGQSDVTPEEYTPELRVTPLTFSSANKAAHRLALDW